MSAQVGKWAMAALVGVAVYIIVVGTLGNVIERVRAWRRGEQYRGPWER